MSSLENDFPRGNGVHRQGRNSKVTRIATAIAGGAVIGYGVKRQSPAIIAIGLLGTGLLCRDELANLSAATVGRMRDSQSKEVARDVHIEKAITINQSPETLYRFWRNLGNLPRFLEDVKSITPLDDQRSHWVVRGPGDTTLEWDAEIFTEKENELISWRSLAGADVTNAGSIHFEKAPDGRGTHLKVTLNYNPPVGKVAALLAKLFGEEPGQLVERSLRRVKQLIETGEISTIEGQPSARPEDAAELPQRKGDKLASKAPVNTLPLTAEEGAA